MIILNRYLFLLLFSFLFVCCCSDKGISNKVAAVDPRIEGVFTLYLLDGDRYPSEPAPEGAVLLHGWTILQTCSISSAATQEKLFKALDDGIAEIGVVPSDMQIDCFNPRHAIRVNSEGVNTDYLICFQCKNYYIWEGDTKVSGGNTSNSPRTTFNRVLADCKKTK